MKRVAILVAVALTLSAALWTSFANEREVPYESKLRVTCTTSLLSSIVTAVGGDKLDVQTIVPFGMCPGHFDLTPGEAGKLRDADILLHHGYESFLKGFEPSAKTRMIGIDVQGNWMIPPLYIRAIDSVATVLAKLMPDSGVMFTERADTYMRAVTEHAERTRESLASVQGMPAVCAEMNRDLAEWFGFRVIAAFARDEDVSLKALDGILTRARKSRAALLFDNMQSSGKIGRTVADELGVPLVMLSNFPEDGSQDDGEPTYITALSNNTAAILKALDLQGKEQ